MMKSRKPRGIAMDASEKFVTGLAYVVMSILMLIAVLPTLHIISRAVSEGIYVTAGTVGFWPRGLQWETVKYVLFETGFLHALKNSLIVTAMGTLISVVVSVLTAYPLSKPSFKGRKLILVLYVFSMVFYGGMIPSYMVVNKLGILNTYAALILPHAVSAFNMFMIKNYFEGLPESVEESARIDGAGDLRILISIVCPMSAPVIATVTLLYAISYWNNYFHSMMYTTSRSMQTLQVYLYDLVNSGHNLIENIAGGSLSTDLTEGGLTAAGVTLSIIPIIALYPLVQRYLMKGITIGSVKG